MPRAIALLACLAIALVASPAAADASPLTVQIKQSRRIVLRGQAANVVVGDSAIADVAMIDSRSVIVQGKGYGSTDILVLDRDGHALLDSRVTVVAGDEGRVTVYRGIAAADYSCSPRCEPVTSTAASAPPTTMGGAPSPATP